MTDSPCTISEKEKKMNPSLDRFLSDDFDAIRPRLSEQRCFFQKGRIESQVGCGEQTRTHCICSCIPIN